MYPRMICHLHKSQTKRAGIISIFRNRTAVVWKDPSYYQCQPPVPMHGPTAAAGAAVRLGAELERGGGENKKSSCCVNCCPNSSKCSPGFFYTHSRSWTTGGEGCFRWCLWWEPQPVWFQARCHCLSMIALRSNCCCITITTEDDYRGKAAMLWPRGLSRLCAGIRVNIPTSWWRWTCVEISPGGDKLRENCHQNETGTPDPAAPNIARLNKNVVCCWHAPLGLRWNDLRTTVILDSKM